MPFIDRILEVWRYANTTCYRERNLDEAAAKSRVAEDKTRYVGLTVYSISLESGRNLHAKCFP